MKLSFSQKEIFSEHTHRVVENEWEGREGVSEGDSGSDRYTPVMVGGQVFGYYSNLNTLQMVLSGDVAQCFLLDYPHMYYMERRLPTQH